MSTAETEKMSTEAQTSKEAPSAKGFSEEDHSAEATSIKRESCHRSANVPVSACKTSTNGSSKEKIHLTGVEMTLMSMVHFKAIDASGAGRAGEEAPILDDPYAQQLLDRCAVDFTSTLLPQDRRWVRYVCGRARRLDEWCQDFLDAHRGEPVTVLHLACGLDMRYWRMRKHSGGGGRVKWIDLDRPMVINLRERLVDPPPDGEDYTLRNLKVGDPGWLRDIPSDRTTLILAEGLFPYLEADEAETAIRGIVDTFQRGELVFDVMGSFMARFSAYSKPFRGKNISLRWGVDDVSQLYKLHPKLRLKDSMVAPEWIGNEPFGKSHPPWFGPLVTAMASMSSSFRNNGQIVRLEF